MHYSCCSKAHVEIRDLGGTAPSRENGQPCVDRYELNETQTACEGSAGHSHNVRGEQRGNHLAVYSESLKRRCGDFELKLQVDQSRIVLSLRH